MSNASTRGTTLVFLATAVLAIAGVAIASAISTGGNSSSVQADASASPSAAVPTVTPAATASPSASASAPAPLPPTPTATQKPSPRPTPTPTPTPVVTATHAVASATPTATQSPCPPAAGRVQAARRLLQHPDALPSVTLVTAGPRQGLLGASDAGARTLTLYVRSCADEPTIQLAFVWGYEAGQFIPTQTWDSSTQAHWARLRGISGTPSSTVLKQDAASVYAFWQTGSVGYWQSPVAPPSYKQLSSLVPFLHMS